MQALAHNKVRPGSWTGNRARKLTPAELYALHTGPIQDVGNTSPLALRRCVGMSLAGVQRTIPIAVPR
jgi:hypothetical protein